MPISNERGSAILVALLLALLVGAIAAALVTVTTTETLIGASYRHAQEASFGAEAALERALHDLSAVPDWSQVLAAPPANLTSGFDDGQAVARGPDGASLDLARLTAARQRDSDARYGASTFGADTPQWRLYAHAALSDLTPATGPDVPIYVVVWVADDESDADGNAAVDSNRRILVWAAAFGAGGARKALEARVARTAAGQLRVDGSRPAH
jgi:hypothetical protein